jgi:hypothetical protein
MDPLLQNAFLPDILLDNNLQNFLNDPSFSQLTSGNDQIWRAEQNSVLDQGSVLSRPTSPPPSVEPDLQSRHAMKRSRTFEISESLTKQLQQQLIDIQSTYVLPSRTSLSLFINQYFKSFHKHQPFLHEATWSPEHVPLSLLFAVCANGAVYSLERRIAKELNQQAIELLDLGDKGIHVLQTQMLLIAFAAWSGQADEIELALRIQSSMTLRLRKERCFLEINETEIWDSWESWQTYESLKR